jgi:DNA/RNA-binding domain of Phe-tRNA-synthetase-like protein
MIQLEPHPSLYPVAFETRLPAPLAELPSPDWLVALLDDESEAPVDRSDAIRTQIRDVFRHGGYKPTGRGKPASEYLVKAAKDRRLGSINAAVDVCNAVSLHSALPISLVDLDRAEPPLRIAIVRDDQRFVFNAAGQEIRLAGLVCLWDEQGPCANGIKDSQRTKTCDTTIRTMSVVWGSQELVDHTDRAVAWYRELCERLGATTAAEKT